MAWNVDTVLEKQGDAQHRNTKKQKHTSEWHKKSKHHYKKKKSLNEYQRFCWGAKALTGVKVFCNHFLSLYIDVHFVIFHYNLANVNHMM